MTDPAADIAIAQANALAARDRLTGSLHQLQAKLSPKVLVRDAARSVSEAGQDAARVSIDAARRNPAPTAGIMALAGLFLARHRITALFKRRKSSIPATAKPSPRAISDREESR